MRLYRSRTGAVFGVCRGLADYFNLNVGWIRFFTVLLFLFTGIWPTLVLYLIAALVMKPEPVLPLETEEQHDFYNSYVSSRQRTVRDLSRRFARLDRRLQRLEDKVTSRDFQWDQRRPLG
jgi:phage shock protein C